MWTPVALVGLLALVPGATDDAIKINHARFTYGPFGMERTEARFLPGDVAYLAYDIENANIDKNTGKVAYSLAMTLRNSKGKLVIGRDNAVETFNAFNSPLQPSFLELSTDHPPGKYTIELTVTDRVNKMKKFTLKKDFEIVKKEFGIVRVGYPQPAPVVNLMGPAFTFNFTVTGYKVNAKKFPDVTVKLMIVDDQDRPTLKNPISMHIPKDLGENARPEDITEYLGFPVTFPLNRAGRFTIRVQATDNLAKKTVKLFYSITVLDPRKYETPPK